MNNFEYIKQMDIDEMAEFCSIFQRCQFCCCSKTINGITDVNFKKCHRTTCKEGVRSWLKQERKQKGQKNGKSSKN